ncbi:hypothetical protein GCM10027275_02870 [Rhabdobacter roseus]|uniref:AAA+ ATPase domain-containing protein n=1 Tax=Rhabdobacter roseus TaxID=1655419 RepID=A0A840TGU6_9BACT|nr:ATP-binding protein [Rhabdobacter roseus]MBB5282175.1 hypothetical protein [Rhabdobacter roseus]
MTERRIYFLEASLAFLREVLDTRLRTYFREAAEPFWYEKASLRAVRESKRFAQLLQGKSLSDEEFILLLLALAPHFEPQLLSGLIEKYLPDGGEFPLFGGTKGTYYRGILPTGETAQFLLGGTDQERRNQIAGYLASDGALSTLGLLHLDAVPEGEPRLSGRLVVNEEVVEWLRLGRISRPRFSPEFGAEYLATDQTWDDLVLNPHTQAQLQELQLWLRYNDTLLYEWGMYRKIKPGYRALFHGPPGTGKTMTATLLGQHTGQDVFRIDLSKVVSKYIGETEKNLSRIFDKAQHKNWILFFDEADAVLGKRTGVKDAHDKYANQEVAYLLQRIETYPGLVILATNLRSNIDEAFTRRLHSIIYFPKPTAEEREQLWRKAFPAQVGFRSTVDFEQLAQQYDLTGAHIINIVQRICLALLAQHEKIVSPELLLEHIQKEYQKEGRLA